MKKEKGVYVRTGFDLKKLSEADEDIVVSNGKNMLTISVMTNGEIKVRSNVEKGTMHLTLNASNSFNIKFL